MAASDKNIIITPNRSGPTAQPEIFFGGSGNNPIRLKVLDDTTGTLSFEGAAGQLFSINNSLTSGSIFSVNDVSGIPSINVDANGIISMAAFGGTVGIGTTAPSAKLSVAGTVSATNIVNGIVVGGSTLTGSVSLTAGSNITLTPSGSTITVASTASGGVTTTAANTWTALQTFSAGISAAGVTATNRLVVSSASATVAPFLISASALNDGVGALRIESTEPDIFLDDTNGGFATVTFASAGDARCAFGRNSGNDMYFTVRDPAVAGGAWKDTTMVLDSSSGNVSFGYDVSVAGNLTVKNVVNSIVVGGATLTGNVSLTAGSNITLTPSGNTITVASTASGGGGVTTTAANTWTATQTFSGGINVSAGATFTSSVQSNTGYRVGAGAINAQTTGYSLVAGDNGKIVTINSASAVTLTAGTAVGTTGFSCTIIQLGAGQVTVAASGTTINSIAGLKFQGQHAAASLICYATNTFNLAGGLTG